MIEVVLLFSDLMTRGASDIVELARLCEKHGYAFDDFGKAKSMKGTLDEVKKQIARGWVSMVLARDTSPTLLFTVAAHEEPHEESGAGTIVRLSMIPSKATVDLLAALASWGDVLEGAGHDEYERAFIDKELWPSPKESIELRAIFQYNVLGKQLVEALGRKRVLSTPGVKMQELSNGAVFLDAGTSAAVHAKAFMHLCGKQMPAREIPARVKPDWDPDLAPVFASIVEREDFRERNALVTRFNELRAAKPDVVSPPRGANLSDPEKAIRQYRSVADELVVLLHDKEPALGANAGPEVLPLIDLHFYNEDYPGSFGEAKTERLLRPLGAWLGELLVRELDGEWAPRGKLDEIEVIVGKTAFLPLLRVRKYLESKDAVLEYSLTKFFADAKRIAKKK